MTQTRTGWGRVMFSYSSFPKTQPLISLKWLCLLILLVPWLKQKWGGVGRITFSSEGSLRRQYVFFSANYELYIDVFHFNISTDSVSYFFKMITLISLVGTLTQTRNDIGRVTFSSRGWWWAYVLLMANIQNTRIWHKDIMVGLRLSFICIDLGQGYSTRGLENSLEMRLCRISDEIIQVREWNFLVPYQDVFLPTLWLFKDFQSLPVSHQKSDFPVGSVGNISSPTKFPGAKTGVNRV